MQTDREIYWRLDLSQKLDVVFELLSDLEKRTQNIEAMLIRETPNPEPVQVMNFQFKYPPDES